MECSVYGCGRPAECSGLCQPHHGRLRRHGDPNLGGPMRATRKQTTDALQQAMGYQGSDCHIWPFARNSAGYGHLTVGGRHTLVHRLVCEQWYGAPPDGFDAAHLCGNGHKGCCSGRHLQWKSRADNHADKILHGTTRRGEAHYLAVLREEQINPIRTAAVHRKLTDIAKEYGVSYGVIRAVVGRKSWAWVP